MQSLYRTCEPRPEVVRGEIREESFAARLKDVLDGTADPVYHDPEIFFDNTYPTAGLRTIVREVLGRLSGQDPAANAVVRLETPFGGGKTHALIALYHAARGSAAAAKLVDPAFVPAPDTVRIAGVVGSDLDPTGGLLHRDVTTYTLWGELAYRLGGLAGYQLVAESDRHTKAAPGSGVLEQLIGDRPTLILLDEIARYLRAASAVPTATGRSDLAEQTIAFLLSLLEFAASRERVVVVLTLADPADAFGKESEELRQRLAEARRVSARSERVITPAGEDETAAIVSHRLFRSIDRAAARETAEVYLASFRRLVEQGIPLLPEVTNAEYAERIVSTYPFHPELLRVLSLRVATIPNFQRTRGALRLLALVVRRLWEQRPESLHLIHPHHIDLSWEPIVEDLTSRLDRPAFKQVIAADIASPVPGQPAHAQRIDQEEAAPGRPPYAQRVATAIFLNSLVQAHAAGIEEPALLASVLEPGDDPAPVRRVLGRLLSECWFLAHDQLRYRFGTEVQLPKVIADEMAVVPVSLAKAKLDERIRHVWQRGAFHPVYFPSEPADIPDDANEPKLAIVHYDAASTTAAESRPPDLVRLLFERAGVAGGFRVYRNNLVFLVADREQIEGLVTKARRYLALERLAGDPARLRDFSLEQQKQLREERDRAELELRVAITRAYRFLYYPSSDGDPGSVPLARLLMPAQDQGDTKANQTEVVVRLLRQVDKVRTGDDKPFAAAYVRSLAWESQAGQVSTEEVRRAFARRVSLPILLDINLLKRTIRDGIRTGTWVYYAARERLAYDRESPEPAIEISEEAFLYTPEEAAHRNLPLAGRRAEATVEPKRCPVCGNPVESCTCGSELPSTAPPPRQLHASGVPAQVLQALSDQAQDAGIERLATLRLRLDQAGQEAVQALRTFGVLVGQLEWRPVRITVHGKAAFGEGERLTVDYSGSVERWSSVQQPLQHLGAVASEFVLQIELEIRFGSDGMDCRRAVGRLRELFELGLLGKVQLTAEPWNEEKGALA